MNNPELVQALRERQLDEMGDVFELLAERVYAHRLENNGFTPRTIFEPCLALGGAITAVEVLVEAVEPGPARVKRQFVLKKRGEDEQSWQGLYQVPGATGILDQGPEDALQRVLNEVWGDNPFEHLSMKHVGAVIYNEPERRCSCWTVVYLLRILSRDVTKLSGDDWRVFSADPDGHVVSGHRNLLKWVSGGCYPTFADMRLPLSPE